MVADKSRVIRCYIHVAHVGSRFVAQLIARGAGTDIYVTKACDTEALAREQVKKYLSKNKGVVLT
jgi:hypothetical protein